MTEWPTGTMEDIRRGSYVLSLASYDADQWSSWSEICDWLSRCPPLDRIKTFWVDDCASLNGVFYRQLLITGMEREDA